VTEPHITYSYHQLFAAFLKKTLLISFNKEKLNDLFLKAASICAAKEDIYEAIMLYIRAGNYFKIYELINSSFESCFSEGNYLLIRKWFYAIGWENIIHNDDVLLNYLKLNTAINDLKTSDNCIRYIEDNLMLNSGDPNYTKFRICKAEYLLLNGKYSESIEIIEELKKLQIKSSGNEELLFLLGKAYYRKGFDFYDIVIETAQNLLNLSIEHNNLKYKIESLRLLGNIYYDKYIWL
jgi:ATP/maltotriose-dependent transcriptional regulator MalT